ncbi:MAG: polysaccharide biosynthesis/export family protein [Candidatus Acidiferrum sp.]
MSTIAFSESVIAQEKQGSTAPVAGTYRISAGDSIQISVWDHPEVTRTVLVKRDGTITLPLFNDLKVTGLSSTDLTKLIRDKLEPFIPKPQVTVNVVRGTPGQRFFQPPSQKRDSPST